MLMQRCCCGVRERVCERAMRFVHTPGRVLLWSAACWWTLPGAAWVSVCDPMQRSAHVLRFASGMCEAVAMRVTTASARGGCGSPGEQSVGASAEECYSGCRPREPEAPEVRLRYAAPSG